MIATQKEVIIIARLMATLLFRACLGAVAAWLRIVHCIYTSYTAIKAHSYLAHSQTLQSAKVGYHVNELGCNRLLHTVMNVRQGCVATQVLVHLWPKPYSIQKTTMCAHDHRTLPS